MGSSKAITIDTGDTQLKAEHLKFVDGIMNGKDKYVAYQEAYPVPIKTKKSMSPEITRLLQLPSVQAELRSRIIASKLTKPYLLEKLVEVIEEKYPMANKDGIIYATVKSPQYTKAISEIAQLAGYYPEKAQVNLAQFNNIVVNLPLGYSEAEKKEMEKMKDQRLVE